MRRVRDDHRRRKTCHLRVAQIPISRGAAARVRLCGGRHFLATLRATPAELRAVTHLFAVIETLTSLGALPTYLRARAANQRVQIGAAHHEIRARQANLGAVEQEPDVRSFRVSSPKLETVHGGFHTNTLTRKTTFYAVLDVAVGIDVHDDLLVNWDRLEWAARQVAPS